MNICIKFCCPIHHWLSLQMFPLPLSKHGNVCSAQKRNIPHDEWITHGLPTWGRGQYKGFSLDNTLLLLHLLQ